MGQTAGDGLFQCLRPFLPGLSGDTEYHICAQIGKTGFLCRADGIDEALSCVYSPQKLQQVVLPCLQPDAEPVEAPLCKGPQLFPVCRSGIALHRDFRILPHRKTSPALVQYPHQGISVTESRSPSAHKNCSNLIVLPEIAIGLHFPEQSP